MSFPLYRALCMSDLVFGIREGRGASSIDCKDHLLTALSSNTTGYYIDLLAAILVYYPVHISYLIAYQLLPPELIPHSQYAHNTSFTHILFHTDSPLLQPLSSIPPMCNTSAIMTSIPPPQLTLGFESCTHCWNRWSYLRSVVWFECTGLCLWKLVQAGRALNMHADMGSLSA